MKSDPRTMERITAHYTIEKALASRLKSAPPDKRKQMYAEVYNELFSKVPDHPQLIEGSAEMSLKKAKQKWQLIKRFVNQQSSFLEIGAGDLVLTRLVAEQVEQVVAVEVSEEIVKDVNLPLKVGLVISDGTSIPVERASMDAAFSNQVMEHLHPDDALEQLQNIFSSLKLGGTYICITPNRLSGPHDVSQYFDQEATGLHLKEYVTSELVELFATAGFRNIKVYWGGKGIYIRCPLFLVKATEAILKKLPYKIRHPLARFYPVRALLGINIVGIK
jgi:SAM-dependent methyltransferase